MTDRAKPDICHVTPTWKVMVGDVREQLALLPDASVQCVVTSPPYWGLRDYGVAGQIGREPSPFAYVAALDTLFDDISRVLKRDGTVWLNLGDTYISGRNGKPGPKSRRQASWPLQGLAPAAVLRRLRSSE